MPHHLHGIWGAQKIYVVMSALTTAIFHHVFKFQIVSTYKVNTSGDTPLHNRLDIHAGMICLIATRPPPTTTKTKTILATTTLNIE